MSPFIKRSLGILSQMEMDPTLIKTKQARKIIKNFFDKKAAAILHEANSSLTNLKTSFDTEPDNRLTAQAYLSLPHFRGRRILTRARLGDLPLRAQPWRKKGNALTLGPDPCNASCASSARNLWSTSSCAALPSIPSERTIWPPYRTCPQAGKGTRPTNYDALCYRTTQRNWQGSGQRLRICQRKLHGGSMAVQTETTQLATKHPRSLGEALDEKSPKQHK